MPFRLRAVVLQNTHFGAVNTVNSNTTVKHNSIFECFVYMISVYDVEVLLKTCLKLD